MANRNERTRQYSDTEEYPDFANKELFSDEDWMSILGSWIYSSKFAGATNEEEHPGVLKRAKRELKALKKKH
jgi:hypothetical protein